MAHFSLFTESETKTREPVRTLAVTGAGGNIGSSFVRQAGAAYRLILIEHPDVEVPDDVRGAGELRAADLRDLDAAREAFRGADGVLHLAANPSAQATWQELHEHNVLATYNAYVAAKAAGCGKLVYASSIHAISGHEEGFQVRGSDPVNPGDVYGVTKCFGEAMGRYMAEQQNLAVIAVRIAAFQPVSKAEQPSSIRNMDAFVSKQDLVQLLQRAVDDTRFRFAIAHGVSRNRFNRMLVGTVERMLGYEPEDDLTRHNPFLRELGLPDAVHTHDEEAGQKSGIREDL
jgi:nucleoside-diphosphate-sugar epimerase